MCVRACVWLYKEVGLYTGHFQYCGTALNFLKRVNVCLAGIQYVSSVLPFHGSSIVTSVFRVFILLVRLCPAHMTPGVSL